MGPEGQAMTDDLRFKGNPAPGTGTGPSKYLEQHHIAVIGGDIASADWTKSPSLFPEGPGLDEMAYETLRATLPYTHGNNKVALLYCAEASACSKGKDYIEKYGIDKKAGVQIVYTKETSLTQISFASECQAAKSAGAGTMLLAGDGSFIERVANSCGQQGLSFEYTAPLGANEDMTTNQYLDGHLHIATHTSPWMANSTAGQKRYLTAVARYYPQLKNSEAAASGWVSGLVAQHILEQMGSGPFTAATFWAAAHSKVKGFNAEGLTSPLTYTAGGQSSPRCAGFADILGGKWVARQQGALTCRSGAPLT
jgi:branched-chain amino acid transport system substrate-binding protein